MDYPTKPEDLQQFVGQVIQFTSEVEQTELDPDPGMKARVLSAKIDDGCFCMVVDLSEFEKQNQPLMKPTYFNDYGEATLRWDQSKGFSPSELKNYKMYADYNLPVFKVVPDLVMAYITGKGDSSVGIADDHAEVHFNEHYDDIDEDERNGIRDILIDAFAEIWQNGAIEVRFSDEQEKL